MNWPSLLLNYKRDPMNGEDVMRTDQRKLTDKEQDAVKTVKGMGDAFHKYLATMPHCNEVNVAMIKLEEAVMWAVKGITK